MIQKTPTNCCPRLTIINGGISPFEPYKTTNQLLTIALPRGAKSIMAHPGVPGQSGGMRAASAVHESDPSGFGSVKP